MESQLAPAPIAKVRLLADQREDRSSEDRPEVLVRVRGRGKVGVRVKVRVRVTARVRARVMAREP